MIKEGRKTSEDKYSTIFDFLFSSQKQKRNKEVRKAGGKLNDYSSALLDIGSQGALYPLTSAFSNINDYLSHISSIEIGGGVKVGLGSGIFADLNKYSQKEISKNRAKANWASIGGSLHYTIDGALASLWARNNGIDPRTSFQIGHIYQASIRNDLIKRAKNPELFGYATQEDIKKKEDSVYQECVDIHLSSILADTHVPQEELKNKVLELQNDPLKSDRIRRTTEFLISYGIDPKDGADKASMIWGSLNDEEDLGLFKVSSQKASENLSQIVSKYKVNEKEALNTYRDIKKTVDPMSQREALTRRFVFEFGLDGKSAMALSGEMMEGWNFTKNDEYDIAKTIPSLVLANGIRKSMIGKGNYAEIKNIQSKINDIFQSDKSVTFGMKTARTALLFNWLSKNKYWGELLMQGRWEKFGTEDLSFTKIVDEVKVSHEGEEIGSYYKEANSVIGKLLGRFYYLHPNNLFKGIFLDGSLLLKWASKNGKLDTKHIGYFLYNMRIGKLLEKITSPLKFVSSGINKFFNPFLNIFKSSMKKILTTIIGASGAAGVVINLIMNFLSDKFVYIVNQIVIIVFVVIIGLLFLLFNDISSSSTQTTETLLQNNNEKQVQINNPSDGVFTDGDLSVGN